MFGFGGWQRQEQRSRARDRAVWLIRDHGDNAEAVLDAELGRAGLSLTSRARKRLVRSALRRERRRRARPGARTPILAAFAGLIALFGVRLGRRHRSGRPGR